MAIAKTAVIYPNVSLGVDVEIGEYVIVGAPPRGRRLGELETRIGDLALIRSHTVIYAGNVIGHHFQTGHGVMIREDNRIGDHVSIGTGSVVEHHVVVEDHVRIHTQAFVPEYSVLKRGCWIGPRAVLTNARYPLSPRAKENLQGPVIEEGAKIGANATLLPGVVIGRDALVGAGAVVVRDVPTGKVVAGNPARVVGDVSAIPDYSGERA